MSRRCWYAEELRAGGYSSALYRFATREERDAFVNAEDGEHPAHGAAFASTRDYGYYHNPITGAEARYSYPHAFTESARYGFSECGCWCAVGFDSSYGEWVPMICGGWDDYPTDTPWLCWVWSE